MKFPAIFFEIHYMAFRLIGNSGQKWANRKQKHIRFRLIGNKVCPENSVFFYPKNRQEQKKVFAFLTKMIGQLFPNFLDTTNYYNKKQANFRIPSNRKQRKKYCVLLDGIPCTFVIIIATIWYFYVLLILFVQINKKKIL